MLSRCSSPVFRFAPSPNGFLHAGHAFSALFNADLARASRGRFLLRVEDIDTERCTSAFEAAIFEDLAWLGLEWEMPVRRQSDHLDDYAAAIGQLSAQDLTYPCFCTRGAIAQAVAGRPGWPRDPDGAPLYPGTCRALGVSARAARIASGEAHTIRLDMAKALAAVTRGRKTPLAWTEWRMGRIAIDIVAKPEIWGDAVISRKQMQASYHIAVVVDDAAQGVSDVARGADLYHATSLHRLLQALLGLPAPDYHHHDLVRDDDGKKLAKSRASLPLRTLRVQGLSPADIRAMTGYAPPEETSDG